MAGGWGADARVPPPSISWRAIATSSAGSVPVPDAIAPPLTPGPARIEEVGTWVEPLEALESVRSTDRPVLLLSGLEDHAASRYSILAWSPLAEVTLRATRAAILHHEGGRTREVRQDCQEP